MWNRLIAVVEEQAQVLMRTAFSPIVRECGDLSAGVFDRQGRMLAQAVTGTPGHVNSMAESVRHFIRHFPLDQMQPILAKSFAQFQLNQRAEVLERKLDEVHRQLAPYGPRVCTDWISQWQLFDHVRRQRHLAQLRLDREDDGGEERAGFQGLGSRERTDG